MFDIVFFSIALLFLVGSLDDLFIDLIYSFCGLRPRKLTAHEWKHWREQAQKPIAIMIPAWHEAAVLEAMVTTNLARITYQNYKWFIGVYPNDADTFAIAKNLEARYPEKVVVVVTDRPGPTSKAHCLNCILKVIVGSGIEPHYIAIHDAEDVIHPDAFTAINAQPADLDFIQVPIFSLPVGAEEWVAGTYLDEFAEIHLREIPVRKVLNMPIPSAGVGTFISYSMIKKIGRRFQYWFDEENLTEDYEISMRLARLGGKQDFLLIFDEKNDIVATREYFPAELGRAIRQKTRWTTGIGLQTMAKWRAFGALSQNPLHYKNLIMAYAMARDRKALWANPTVLTAWFLITLLAFSYFVNPTGSLFRLQHTEWALNLIFINCSLFAFRLFQRARFCARIYGSKQGLLAIPRTFLSTYINGIACIKALTGYLLAARKNQQTKITWDKTEHRFPDFSDQLPGLKTSTDKPAPEEQIFS